MKLSFKQELTEKEVYLSGLNVLFGIDDADFDVQDLKAAVSFSANLNIRKWGIDGIDIKIQKVEVTADLNIEKEYLTQQEIIVLKQKGFKEYEKDLTLFGWNLSTENASFDDSFIDKKGQIQVSGVRVRIKKRIENISIDAIVS